MSRKALTIIEVLVVLIIIAILSAVAVPKFNAKVECAYGEKTIENIEFTADALRRYCVRNNINSLPWEWGLYVGDQASIEAINAKFSLELNDNHFNYNITGKNYTYNIPYGEPTITWVYAEIKATRNSGTYVNKTIIYNTGLTSEQVPHAPDWSFEGPESGWDHENSTWPWMPE